MIEQLLIKGDLDDLNVVRTIRVGDGQGLLTIVKIQMRNGSIDRIPLRRVGVYLV